MVLHFDSICYFTLGEGFQKLWPHPSPENDFDYAYCTDITPSDDKTLYEPPIHKKGEQSGLQRDGIKTTLLAEDCQGIKERSCKISGDR